MQHKETTSSTGQIARSLKENLSGIHALSKKPSASERSQRQWTGTRGPSSSATLMTPFWGTPGEGGHQHHDVAQHCHYNDQGAVETVQEWCDCYGSYWMEEEKRVIETIATNFEKWKMQKKAGRTVVFSRLEREKTSFCLFLLTNMEILINFRITKLVNKNSFSTYMLWDSGYCT